MKKISPPTFQKLSTDLNLYWYSLNKEEKEFFINYLVETIFKWGNNQNGV